MTGRVICADCRHPRPLHSNGTSECKARGCHAGPDGTACREFRDGVVAEADAVPAVLVPKFRSAADAQPLAAASG